MMQEQNPNISIFWVIGTNHIAFQESITRLGRHLGLSSSHGSGFTDFRGVADWLGSDAAGPWILVIDDIDLDTFDYWQVLQGALPRTFSGSILFTTQNKKVAYALVEPHQESVVSMEKRSPDEVRQLLLLQLGPTTLCQGHSDSIIDHIGYVTSDTAQAAAYTTSTPILPTTCTHNLTQSEACGTNLLNEANTGNTSLQVCAMCGGSLLASFDAVCMHNSAAAEILAIIACIAPQRMSRDLFVYVGNHFQLEEGLRLLKSQSIIVTDDADENFSMCSLVHRSFQQQLKRKSGFSLHAYSVLRFLSDFFPATTEQYHRLPECRNYLPHAISVWNTVFGDNDGRPYPYLNLASASQLASQISLYLRIIGKYQEAKIFALRAYECVSRGLGPVSPQALICQANIGTIEQCLGDTKLFSKRIDTTLRAGASVVRAHDPEAIPLLRKKGLALQAEGRHAEAEGYHRQAIYLSERVHGADDIKTLNEQHGLALSLIGQRQLSEALILLEHIRDCMSMSLNSDNPRIYSILFNIGGVLQLQSHWEEAGQVIAQALAGRERVLGESHPQTLHCKANMALIYISKGNSTKAEELTREVLAAHETQLGLDHPLSLHMQNNLGYILLDQKRYSEAEEVLNQVVNGRARKLGAEHGETLASMFYLAEALENLGKYAQAFEVAETILAVRQRTLKESDVDRVVSEAQVERLECAFREWLSARTLVGSIADAEMGDSDMSSNSSVGVSTPETISSATFSDTVVDVDSGLLT
jgi:tetratricopeptide (TPR) repeat protein